VTAPLRLCVRRSAEPTSDAPDWPVEISIRVPSDLDVVEEAVDLVARHCLAAGLPPASARFKLRVALSEALANAIIYGNRHDSQKSVDVRVEVSKTMLAVHVSDEGDGFRPQEVPDPTLPDGLEQTSGRGLFLIREMVDDVRFNEKGNSVCMMMRRV
jgi:serine/threonine-protein kinase RsbW